MRGDIPYWGAGSIVDYVNDYLFDETLVLLGEDGAPFFDSDRPVAHLVSGRVWVNNHIHVLSANGRVVPEFLVHALNSVDYADYIDGSTRDKLTQGAMASIRIPLPPLAHQRSIVDYLQSETAHIDTLIDHKRRFIELLLEKRTALITQAVTQGLDPSAEMKPWPLVATQHVPAHWALLRAKFILRERDVRSEDGSEELLTVSHLTGVTPRSEKQVYMFMAETNQGYKVCRQGDLAINTMWAYQGAAGIAPCHGIVSPSYNVYAFTREVDPRYYDLLVRSRPVVAEFDSRSTGIWKSRLRLYPSEFLDILLPVPPLEEQSRIVAAIDAETGKMDRLIETGRASVDVLQEYRAALISAAVTGQIDIPSTETSEDVA